MKVDHELVRRVAALARLEVPEERLPALAAELSAILDYADQLGAFPAEPEPPPSLAAPRRADEVEPPAGRALIALAAERLGDEVRVPKVLGEPP